MSLPFSGLRLSEVEALPVPILRKDGVSSGRQAFFAYFFWRKKVRGKSSIDTNVQLSDFY
jgi:hypothetical protein